MTEMEETDLGLDAEPESASQAPKSAAKVAAADPEMDDLLATKKLAEAPPPARPAGQADEAELAPTPARAAVATQAPVDEPRVAREGVAAGEAVDEAAPSPLPLPPAAPKAAPAVAVVPLPLPPAAPKTMPAVAATSVAQQRAQPEPLPSPAPLEQRLPAPQEPRDEIELAAIGGSARTDLSRSPTLAGNGQWDCPFPSEAARAGVDSAIVTLRVEVTADSHIESVIVLRDPGDGFGREARRCALSKRWQPGLDREGRAAQRTTVVSVLFQRKG